MVQVPVQVMEQVPVQEIQAALLREALLQALILQALQTPIHQTQLVVLAHKMQARKEGSNHGN